MSFCGGANFTVETETDATEDSYSTAPITYGDADPSSMSWFVTHESLIILKEF